MEKNIDHFKEFRKDLLKPTAAFNKMMYEKTKIDDKKVAILIPICNTKFRQALKITPIMKKIDHIGDLSKFNYKIKPKSLDHLKLIAGVPSTVNTKDGCSCVCELPKVCWHHLPTEEKFKFEALDVKQRKAVIDLAKQLLYNPIDKKLLKKIPYIGVVEYMLARAKDLAIFFARNLIVCSGETVEFQNYSALFFHNVIVYGSGRIILGNNTKLHAYQVKHVN